VSLDETDGIVTPEAVLLEFGVAGLATRMLAKLVDLVLLAVLGGGITMAVYFLTTLIGTTPARIALVLGWFAVIVFVPMVVETVWDGSSPGKHMMKLRVVTTDGGPVSFRHAAVRTLIALVEIPSGLGLLVALAGSRTQRMGDLAAGTFVIKDIATSTEVQPIVFYPPRGLESFTSLLDVSRVSAPQFQAIRSLLLRVRELDSAARYQLSLAVAEAVSARTTPTPPPGVPPEYYLICIASAYQERNGTLAHQRALRALGYGS
jgi:uncharacterized RDD family membrane protein YckC